MKATGIIRKIDELGRIVIPKEIRRNLRIRESDSMEIYTSKDKEVVLRKYSPFGETREMASEFVDSMSRITGMTVIITDVEKVIAAGGPLKRSILGKQLSDDLVKIMDDRQSVRALKGEEGFIYIDSDKNDEYYGEIIVPVICEGDILGAVVILSDGENVVPDENDADMARVAADFFGKHFES